MPVISNNPNHRYKFDAFRVLDVSGQEPLQNAIACALRLRQSAEILGKALESAPFEERGRLAIAIAKCVPDEFNAWIKVAEFVYAKPRQSLEVSGSLTLEQLLSKSWEQPKLEIANEI